MICPQTSRTAEPNLLHLCHNLNRLLSKLGQSKLFYFQTKQNLFTSKNEEHLVSLRLQYMPWPEYTRRITSQTATQIASSRRATSHIDKPITVSIKRLPARGACGTRDVANTARRCSLCSTLSHTSQHTCENIAESSAKMHARAGFKVLPASVAQIRRIQPPSMHPGRSSRT